MANLGETLKSDAQGHLWMGGCNLETLAATYGTPLFVYDESYLRNRIREMHRAFQTTGCDYQIAYASKAFCTLAMCQLAFEEGCALDVVSGGELYTALQANVDPKKIHMHGNNKTRWELEYAVASGIGIIIVDNFNEIRLLHDVASEAARTVDILIRVAPDVAVHSHEFISTGQADSKFGFDLTSGQAAEALRQIADCPYLRCVGLHFHIGSQIFDTAGFDLAIQRVSAIYQVGVELGMPFSVLDVGGGFGIRYTEEDSPQPLSTQLPAIVEAAQRTFGELNLPVPAIWIEPGRSIVGPAGITLYTVGSEKMVPNIRNYVAVDGGMSDNPRFALYGAKYEAVLVSRANEIAKDAWTIVGKCCESGDIIAKDVLLPTPRFGDILAVLATGAYNYSMASHYNRILKPAVVFVAGGDASVVVERETLADLVRFDKPLVSTAVKS